MNGWQIALLVSGLIGMGAIACAGESASKLWRGWDTYHVIMWSTGEPKDLSLWFKSLREIGCTAEECYRGRDATRTVNPTETLKKLL